MQVPNKDVTQSILAAFQAIALVVGACWVIFRYLGHERESERLVRQQVLLNNEQLIRLAGTQKAIEEARLRQLQLGNKQSELMITVQDEQQRLALATQKVGTAQAQLALETAKAQQQLRRDELDAQVRLAQLDAQKREQEVSYAGEIRFTPTHALTCKKLRDVGDGLAEYELTYNFRITSQSLKPFDVSFFVIDLYVGLPKESRSLYKTRRLNVPNLRNATMVPRDDDAVDWKHVNAVGSILQETDLAYGAVERPSWSFFPPVEIGVNTVGLGHLRHGEWCSREETYFVVAPRDAYVTAFLAYCLNSCTSEAEGFTGSNFVALLDAEKPAKGRATAPPIDSE